MAIAVEGLTGGGPAGTKRVLPHADSSTAQARGRIRRFPRIKPDSFTAQSTPGSKPGGRGDSFRSTNRRDAVPLRCQRPSLPSAMPSRKYTDDQLKASLASARNMRELLISLGLVPRGGNYETVWRRISKLDLDASHFHQFQRGKTLRSFSDEE